MLSQNADCAEDAEFHRPHRGAERFGNFFVGLFFDQSQSRRHLKFCGQAAECLLDFLLRLALDYVVRCRTGGGLVQETFVWTPAL